MALDDWWGTAFVYIGPPKRAVEVGDQIRMLTADQERALHRSGTCEPAGSSEAANTYEEESSRAHWKSSGRGPG